MTCYFSVVAVVVVVVTTRHFHVFNFSANFKYYMMFGGTRWWLGEDGGERMEGGSLFVYCLATYALHCIGLEIKAT